MNRKEQLRYFREYNRKNAAARRAYAKAYYRRKYADPIERKAYLERTKRWVSKNKDKKAAAQSKWLSSPNGRKYLARISFHLPSNAPDELVQTCQLLRAIRKEMRNEHNRA